ncbi:carbohydrate binding domain-containing protein [Marinicrinis lubricantis]|uniref:Carbohydrate binding domain-containing protein n=1 Tax=Marinicrinis lubricantis TaxID=2086470 RepID=A0ABW1IP05_9BACL
MSRTVSTSIIFRLSVSLLLVWAVTAAVLKPAAYAEGSGPQEIGDPIVSIALYDSSYGIEEGKPVVYTTVSGSPAIFNVVDIQSNKLLRSFPLEGASSSWSHLTAASGEVYIATERSIFRYSPQTQQVTNIGSTGQTAHYGLSEDEQGNIYVGTFPDGKVFQYQPATGEFRDYGTVVEGQSYVRGGAYYDGYYYAGVGIVGHLVRIDVVTGEKKLIELPEIDGSAEYGSITTVTPFGSKLYVWGSHEASGKSPVHVYDPAAEQWEDIYFENHRGLIPFMDEENNKLYILQDGKLIEIDGETLETRDTGVAYSTYLRGSMMVELPNDPELPGKSFVTVTFGGGLVFMNLETQVTKSVQMPVAGNPVPIQTIDAGPNGEIFASGYPGGIAGMYDPSKDELVRFSMGQAEGMVAVNGRMYFGVYPGASIRELDLSTSPLSAEELFTIEGQDRPFVMRSDGEKLYIGTIADYGKLNGALTIYDLETGETEVYDNIVENQSVVGIALKDGKLYGSTTVHGGLGIDPVTDEAKLFVFDLATKQKVTEFTMDIAGRTIQPRNISGLTIGPDGLLWGGFEGTIFAIDTETLEVVKSKELYPGTGNHRWRPAYIRVSDDGMLYTTIGNYISVVDPETLEYRMLDEGSMMDIGNDGMIYYAKGTKLMKVAPDYVRPNEPDPEEPNQGRPNNLLDNPGFEEPVTESQIPGWSWGYTSIDPAPNYFEVTSDRAYEGSHSLRLVDVETTKSNLVQSIPIAVNPGEQYTAAAQVYLETGRLQFLVQFYDESGNYLSAQTASQQVTSGHGTWQEVVMPLTIPEGAATARVGLYCSTLWVTSALFDQVYFGQPEAAGAGTFHLEGPSAVKENDQFTVTIGVSGANDLFALDAKLDYDEQFVQYISHSLGSGFEDGFLQVNDSASELAIVATMLGQEGGVSAEYVEAVKLVFQMLQSSGSTDFTLKTGSALASSNADETKQLQILESDIPFSIDVIQDPEDVNGDGVVNLVDLVLVAKHLQAPVTEETARLDINRDSVIDIADVSLVAYRIMN